MKKLLIVLMVLAMSSFLFTGCIPTTPTPVAVTGVTLDQATMTLTAGGATGTLVATVAPATATNKSVTWSSSASAVATVANGVVTPVTAGTTTITVTTVDGSFTATCAVTVAPTVVPATVAPIITDIPDIVGGYVNAANAANGIVVNGTAPTFSEVKVYINGICAGTGDAQWNGVFSVVVANADLIKAGLKVDGTKTVHAIAQVSGLAASASSNILEFILDTVAPKISSSKAKAGIAGTAAVVRVYSVAETADTMALFAPTLVKVAGGTTVVTVAGISEAITDPFTAVPAAALQLPAGVTSWKIEVLTITSIVPGDDAIATVRVTNLTAVTSQDYTFSNVGVIVSTSWIPGAIITTAGKLASATDIGAHVLITTTNTPAADAVAGTAGYIDVTFDEDVTGASILAGTWTAYSPGLFAVTPTVQSSKIARITENVIGFLDLADTYIIICSNISDLAGNTIAPLSTSTGVVMP